MDVSQILAELKNERKQVALRLVALSRAVKILRRLRGPIHHAKITTSNVAANRSRGRKAWATRVRNQKKKLALVRGKVAA
jgi:hypothetical protein